MARKYVQKKKKFGDWKKTKRLTKYKKQIAQITETNEDELMYEITGKKNINGIYIHQYLFFDLASWVSERFAFDASKIAIQYYINEKNNGLNNTIKNKDNIIKNKDNIIKNKDNIIKNKVNIIKIIDCNKVVDEKNKNLFETIYEKKRKK